MNVQFCRWRKQIFNCRQQQENPAWAHLSPSQPSRADRKHESSRTSAWLCQTYLDLTHSAEFVSCSPDTPSASQWAKRQKAVRLAWSSSYSQSDGPYLSGETSLALPGVPVMFIAPTWEKEEGWGGTKGHLWTLGASRHSNPFWFCGIFLLPYLSALFFLLYPFSSSPHAPF